jgi:hypothetical protein
VGGAAVDGATEADGALFRALARDPTHLVP